MTVSLPRPEGGDVEAEPVRIAGGEQLREAVFDELRDAAFASEWSPALVRVFTWGCSNWRRVFS